MATGTAASDEDPSHHPDPRPAREKWEV